MRNKEKAMRVSRALGILTLVLMMPVRPVPAADTLKIKLATMAPDGSPWHKILKDMGNEWQEQTQGRVRLVIYPGGVAGDDRNTLRKIRHRQLHAGTLTVGGLSDIDPAFNVFSIPLFFDSYEEYAHVLEAMTPVLQERLEAKGFILLHWAYGGWVHIFSKQSVETVDDLKRLKMFTGAGDEGMVRLWKSNGFTPVALAPTDIMMGLQSGMIEGVPVPPLGALAMQWFKHVPYMLDPGVAPLVGGTVISREAWNKISEPDRTVLVKAAHRAEERLAREIPEKDSKSIDEMEKRGLTVVRVEAGEGAASWRATAESFAKKMRASMVPEDVFDMAMKYRTDFRKGLPSQDPR